MRRHLKIFGNQRANGLPKWQPTFLAGGKEDRQTMQHMVVIETQKTKSYLFASPFMRETRGASVLLDLLNRKRTRELLAGPEYPRGSFEEVYLGGGSGRVLFADSEHAETFRRSVLEMYRTETTSARVAVEVVPREADGDAPESFARWVARGVERTGQHKLGRMEGVPILGGRWIRPCSSCGVDPAETMKPEHDNHHLCRSCLKKRVEVNRLYRETKPGSRGLPLKPEAELVRLYTKGFIFSTLAHYCEALGFRVRLPQELNDIGDCSHPSNYMGFIYADGNRMGEAVKRIGQQFNEGSEVKRAYTAFSEIVDCATRLAAVESVLKAVRPISEDSNEIFIPAEFIMAGGDDLVLVVPAHEALDVAVLFMQRYQEITRELQGEYIRDHRLSAYFAPDGLTTSAGVVLAHTHYPVSDLLGLAGQLMKKAKLLSARRAGKGVETGSVDFMVLSEAGSAPLSERRKREYGGSSGNITLTERPYTVDEARSLLRRIRELKASDVPRSKLKALYASVFQHEGQAVFDGLVIRERLRVSGVLDGGGPLVELFGELDRFPFRQKDVGALTTPITEIVELYDFIQPAESRGIETRGPQTVKEASHD